MLIGRCPFVLSFWTLTVLCSNRMANVSAVCHTLISTCRANGIAALAYLEKFLCAVAKGRRDYESLQPTTIGINTDKL